MILDGAHPRAPWRTTRRRLLGRLSILAGAAAAFPLRPFAAQAAARPLGLRLPTPNDALFRGAPSRFYMFVDRTFEGSRSSPWEAGQYGYVRNPKRSGGALVYSRFHEGIDIAPTKRDKNGEPLDLVHAIADGRVVHTNSTSSRSNYGRYVVVEHDWGDGPFYSLYAHLMAANVKPAQRVRAGAPLGRMGYTGAGIDRRRAHVHLELNLMLNGRFEQWHSIHFRDPNHHGAFNGLNLAGIDIAGLFQAHRADPRITLPAFIARMKPYFRVVVPKSRGFDLVDRYPWLLRRGSRSSGAASWEITFSSSGVPLAVEPSGRAVRHPAVTWVAYSPHYHSWNTRGRLTGSGSSAALSEGGTRYVQLVGGTF